MYYIVNNGSPFSFSQQIANTDTFVNFADAKSRADALKNMVGGNWGVIQITSVYTTQTLYEAMLEAPDVPMMERA